MTVRAPSIYLQVGTLYLPPPVAGQRLEDSQPKGRTYRHSNQPNAALDNREHAAFEFVERLPIEN